MRFHQHDVSGLVAAHAFGFAFFDLRHLPCKDELPVGRKLLHASGHIDDEEIVLGIKRNRARFVQLAHAGPARTDNFDAAKKFAFDGNAFAIIDGTAGENEKEKGDEYDGTNGTNRPHEIEKSNNRPRKPGNSASTSSNRQRALTWELWP